jgi:G:T-mismatch repair DNA endonuclease (very short patch repair protein)
VKICGAKVDGFDEKTNTAYQYHGCFWHGCKKCYNQDFINKITKMGTKTK